MLGAQASGPEVKDSDGLSQQKLSAPAARKTGSVTGWKRPSASKAAVNSPRHARAPPNLKAMLWSLGAIACTLTT